MAGKRESSESDPAQPVYVLRGHGSAIHALDFFQQNTRLLSGDSDGWIVIWDVTIKRPVAVWQAHDASIISAKAWKHGLIIS